MPPRSKVITILPANIRQELERRLVENSFSDYQGLAQWVRGQGYDVSDDSLWRYGRALQQQLLVLKLTTCQLVALSQLSTGDEVSMAQALITIAHQKAFSSLIAKP